MSESEELPAHWQRWYHEWHENVLDDDTKRRLQGELSGRDDRKAYSAAFELYLFSLFRVIGLNVEFQPMTNGVNADFLISDKWHNRSRYAFVEAGVMYSDPLERSLDYQAGEYRIWEDFKNLKSTEFQVSFAHSSGNPGNVRGKEVKREVQEWISRQEPSRLRDRHSLEYLYYTISGIFARETFEFHGWNLEVELELKTPQESENSGDSAVPHQLVGFSGSWTDSPGTRLKLKLAEKFSQVRKTEKNCIVAITERMSWPSDGEIQQALWGGNIECLLDPNSFSLVVPKINAGGLWSKRDVVQPMAALIHRGNLKHQEFGQTELWLNPNVSPFEIPLPLFSLKVCAAEQKIWVRPASHPGVPRIGHDDITSK